MSIPLRYFVSFLAVASYLSAAVKEIKPGFNLFSKQQDIQLGREAAAQVERQMQIVRDPALQSYVERIGRKLVSSPKAGEFPYSFKVVNDPTINAFALPGGFTFVQTGLLKSVENEAQLAGVLAHEISHVALRHGTHQASKANVLQLPAMIAGVALGNGSLLGQLAQVGVGLGFNSLLLKYSRDAEKQADLLGAQIMADAGYNPIEMAHFFEKLAAQGGSRAPTFMSDHPDPGDRTRYVEEEVRELPQRDYTTNGTGELSQIQSRLGSLPAPNGGGNRTRSMGAVGQGDPRPSGQFREYRNNAFSISYPDNWEVFGDRGGATVTIAPRSGLMQDRSGSVAVGYGVMINFYDPHRGDGRGGDLRQDTYDLIGELKQNNPALQAGTSQQQVRVGNGNGLVTTLTNQSPMGGREYNMMVTVERSEGLFYMIFIAPEQSYRQLQPVFESMLRSVRF